MGYLKVMYTLKRWTATHKNTNKTNLYDYHEHNIYMYDRFAFDTGFGLLSIQTERCRLCESEFLIYVCARSHT